MLSPAPSIAPGTGGVQPLGRGVPRQASVGRMPGTRRFRTAPRVSASSRLGRWPPIHPGYPGSPRTHDSGLPVQQGSLGGAGTGPSRFPPGPSSQLDSCTSSPIFPVPWRFPVWRWKLCDTETTVCPLPLETANLVPRPSALGLGSRRSRTPCPYDAYCDGVCTFERIAVSLDLHQ